MHGDGAAVAAAERATNWLLSLQTPAGAFSGGLHGSKLPTSVFNTRQILPRLGRAYRETKRPEVLASAVAAGDWLVNTQQPDGSWSGPGAYQNTPHTYYSMVAWALAELSEQSADHKYGAAAEKNLDWVLSRFPSSGWADGI